MKAPRGFVIEKTEIVDGHITITARPTFWTRVRLLWKALRGARVTASPE